MKDILRPYFSVFFILFFSIFVIYHMPVSAAEVDYRCGDNLTWSLENGKLTIQGKGEMYHYTESQIPWRAQSDRITSVEVLPGVTSISAYSFYNYSKLTSASLADSVVEIGERAFYRCISLNDLNLPSHIALLPLEGFYECKALTELKIPNSVTAIGTSAFRGCSGLTSLTIPDSVNTLGQYAFYRCENLETVNIGIGLNGFGYDIFYGCPKLSKVNISPDNPHHSSINGVVYSKEKDILLFHPPVNGTSLTIPNSVFSVENDAFDENYTGLAGHVSMLKEIYFEGSAPTLGRNCFYSITADVYYPEDDDSWTGVINDTYGGTITWKPYKLGIEKMSLEDCQITLEYDHTPWTGNPKYPDSTVMYHGTTLKEGVHYDVSFVDNKAIGTAKVIFTGLGSYTGSVTKTFAIEKAKQTLDLSIPNTVIEVGHTNEITAIGTRGSLYIRFASDHPEIATVDQRGKVTGIAPGTTVITVTSEGNDTYLPISKTLTITVIPVEEGPFDINKCEINMNSSNQSYTGYPMEAVFIIKRGSSTYLVENRDYTVTCSNCTDTGTATAVIQGIGDYTGSATYTYQILPAGQSVKASASKETILIGETAQITVDGIGKITYISRNPEIASVDSNGTITGVAVGSAMIEVTASGDKNHNAASHVVRMKVEAPCSPELIPVSDCSITLKQSEYVYDGTAKCPEAEVVYHGKTLIPGTDYIITYSNNVNAGYPKATVVGKGEYTSSANPITYHIKRALQTVRISNSSPLMLKVGESAKIEAVGIGRLNFFTATANNSLEIGTNTGIVTGLAPGSVEVIVQATGDDNHMSGDARISVQVVGNEATPTSPTNPTTPTSPTAPTESPKPVTLAATKVTANNTASSMKISWNRVTGASGYYVYRAKGSGTYQLIKKINAAGILSYEDSASKLVNGASYTYAVRAYQGSVIGKSSSVSAFRVNCVSITSLSNSAKGKLLAKWTKNNKASGYVIQCSKSNRFTSGVKTVNVTKWSTNKRTISSLKKKKTYYVRIRAYKKNTAGKKYYSAWSTIRSKKIKK